MTPTVPVALTNRDFATSECIVAVQITELGSTGADGDVSTRVSSNFWANTLTAAAKKTAS
ncbi:MAG: hypothetical protein HUU55_16805 [Myxococcales bacterium]|nr:hypothetical protein [Myxococcales bacterium]